MGPNHSLAAAVSASTPLLLPSAVARGLPRGLSVAAPLAVLGLAGLATGCSNDQGLGEITLERVAVATGDFDRVEEVLSRLLVDHHEYEGYIAGPVYDDQVEPGQNALTVEQLFTGVDSEGTQELFQHDAVFVNSGVRGLGDVRYDGLEPDDSLLVDPAVAENVRAYVEGGHALVASDWAYDLVEAAWPEAVVFYVENQGPDAAQVGVDELVLATVDDPGLAEALGGSSLQLSFDYSHWVVMTGVGEGTTVHLRGDVTLRPDDETGDVALPDVPLLVSFPAGSGRVVLSAFHWRAQRAAVADLLLQAMLPELRVGTAADSGAAAGVAP